MSDSESGGLGFDSRAGHLLDFVLGHPEFKSSATLVNSQLVVSSCQLGFFNPIMFYLGYFFLVI